MAKSKEKKILVFMSIFLLFVLLLSACSQTAITEPIIPNEQDNGETIEDETTFDDEPVDIPPERSREEIEKERMAIMGDYYVPLPPEGTGPGKPIVARGIYMTGNTVGIPSRFNSLISFIEGTELNAVVIDVKDDNGLMTYRSNVPAVDKVDGNRYVRINDIRGVINLLEEKGIYPIARVVVFKDPNLSSKRPDISIQRKEGGVWRDPKGVSWVNPFNKEVWDYTIAISKEAALMGFKEIQFDYVRFPENARRVDREAIYPGQGDRQKDDAIMEFLQYAREELKDYGVVISADVFGVIATSWGDSDGIGQSWEKISPNVDIISPMVYPSHYGPGYFGLPVPDANPYQVIKRSMTDSILRNAAIENPAAIRPWLQDFTAPWVPGYIPYGVEEIRAQIRAARELGIDQYLLWNAGNRYTERAIYPPEEGKKLFEQYQKHKEENNLDVLGRTKEWTAREVLRLWNRRDYRNLYPLVAVNFRYSLEEFRELMVNYQLTSFKYKDIVKIEEGYYLKLDYSMEVVGTPIDAEDALWPVYMENGIWKVRIPITLTR